MLFRNISIGLIGAIVAIAAGTQSATFAQDFNTPTDPTLSEMKPSTVDKPGSTSQPQMRSVESATPEEISVPDNGQTFFSHPPRLTRSATSQVGSSIPSSYEFTITVPADAGQPMRAVTIAQATNLETVRFNLSQSKASTGSRYMASSAIPLASVGGEQPSNPDEVTIVFDQPVQPGSTVTVAVAVERTPTIDGAYDFDVTAYPIGKNAIGQSLGYGRINFYGNSY